MSSSFIENLPFFFAFGGVSILMALASYGSCHGMAQAVTASVMYIQKKSIMTSALLAVIMISIIFFLALVVSILILNRLDSNYSLASSFNHFVACLVMGGVGAVCGKSMGGASSSMFRVLHKKDGFFLSFMLIFSTAELAVIFAFLISLTLIYK
ncbi:Vacuolar ATP synthase 16 kDa proteolipid subunit 2 [Nosema bombycis CQ1]|uniref:Vacuolar ATP synthase 16 kDa proteolipid subunit 2 n=1 Tax=Nosema bombycis (strain CQ1 / CVCC 102059) TaxID=578461 RepID=R0MAK4_NOSB1|nr:Vacuolar ATP synthase 16 kDa proteolipid subunit 2 [Nosema bombycis CQ1]|eukprot:EOB14984.1 Vacuolar ATP synthase 16 kDa proteolipid subunit 2 [Nosema bombycis CQ1]